MTTVHGQLAPILEWLFDRNPLLEDVDRKARLLLLDTVGCLLAGIDAPIIQALARGHASAEPGVFTFPGYPALNLPAATEIGATAIVWDEACEGLARAHGRPGIAVIAATLPLAVVRDLPLAQLLAAVIAGYEIGGRMGAWLRIRPGMHVDAGWPALGAAAGVAHLIGCDARVALAAVEIAACQVPFGLYAPVKAGANGRNTYIAHAALLGGLAARAAAAGCDAPDDALAQYAAIALQVTEAEPQLLPAGVSLILEGYLKPFPSVRHAHYGTAAAMQLREQLTGRIDTIEAIELATYDEAITYASNRAPATPLAAQFSMSFAVAAALRFGSVTPEVYRDVQFRDSVLRRLEALVTVVADRTLTEQGRRGATLKIRVDGKEHVAAVDRVKGDPADPMTSAECRDKFIAYAEQRITRANAIAFADGLLGAAPQTTMGNLWKLLGATHAK